MEQESSLDKIPSRVKYYLLDWKDTHMDEYLKQYNSRRLRDLNEYELHELFSYATTQDSAALSRIASENPVSEIITIVYQYKKHIETIKVDENFIIPSFGEQIDIFGGKYTIAVVNKSPIEKDIYRIVLDLYIPKKPPYYPASTEGMYIPSEAESTVDEARASHKRQMQFWWNTLSLEQKQEAWRNDDQLTFYVTKPEGV